MYHLFIGNYQEIMHHKAAFYKKGDNYIPCTVTGYHFKPREYEIQLVNEHNQTSVFRTKKIYVKERCK